MTCGSSRSMVFWTEGKRKNLIAVGKGVEF